MDEKEKRLRKAIDALHRYAQNPDNALSGPAFSELLDELYLAKNAMTAQEFSDTEVSL